MKFLDSLTCFFKQAIYFYQRNVSRHLGPRCRFYPSCSHYADLCLTKHGLPLALAKICSRLLRCQPWNKGGFDYP